MCVTCVFCWMSGSRESLPPEVVLNVWTYITFLGGLYGSARFSRAVLDSEGSAAARPRRPNQNEENRIVKKIAGEQTSHEAETTYLHSRAINKQILRVSLCPQDALIVSIARIDRKIVQPQRWLAFRQFSRWYSVPKRKLHGPLESASWRTASRGP